jgi:hypothetical protein
MNIKSHVPIILELTDPSYDEWHAFNGKFDLGSHLSSPLALEQHRDPTWHSKISAS